MCKVTLCNILASVLSVVFLAVCYIAYALRTFNKEFNNLKSTHDMLHRDITVEEVLKKHGKT